MRRKKRIIWCVAASILAIIVAGCKPAATTPDVRREAGPAPAVEKTPAESAAPAVGAVDKKGEAEPAPTPAETGPKVESTKVAYVPIDISASFNASATRGAEGLDGYGNVYPADKLPRNGQGLKPGSPPFDLPDFTKIEKNVVTAAGQTLKTPDGKYSALYVLAVATDGDQESKLLLGYGQQKVEAAFKISDWCRKPKFGEVQAASYARVSGENETARCKLYIQKVALDPAKNLSSITLPVNERIHIFAMTLAR